MKYYQLLKKIALPNDDIRPLGFILSILLSLIWYSKGQPINIDGMTYLQLAESYVNSGMGALFHNFNWPFYPLIIGICSKFLGLSVFAAANLLNTLFFGLIVVAFITISKTLQLSLTSQIIACAVILFFPTLANERAQLYRDYGFYCFMLLGFNAILRFEMQETYQWFIAWIVFTLLAGLFRIEGIVFLFTVPVFTLLWQSSQKKWLLIKTLGTYVVIIAALSVFYFSVIAVHYRNLQVHSLISTDFVRVFQHIASDYATNKQILNDHLLSIFAYNNAGIILISGIIGIIIISIIKGMLPVNLFLSIYGWGSKSLVLNKNQKLIFICYIFTYLLILAGFTSQHFFLTERYVMLLCILLFLPIAPAIENFYRQYSTQLTPKHWAGYFSTFILISAIISITSSITLLGVDKRYYQQSAEWVNHNTAKNASVFMSDPRLTFYVKRAGTKFPDDFPFGVSYSLSQQINLINQNHYQYAMIVTQKSQINLTKAVAAQSNLALVKSFINNRGDQILIFKRD